MCFSTEDSPPQIFKIFWLPLELFEENTVCLSRNVKKLDEAEKIVLVYSTSLYPLGWGKAYYW